MISCTCLYTHGIFVNNVFIENKKLCLNNFTDDDLTEISEDESPIRNHVTSSHHKTRIQKFKSKVMTDFNVAPMKMVSTLSILRFIDHY